MFSATRKIFGALNHLTTPQPSAYAQQPYPVAPVAPANPYVQQPYVQQPYVQQPYVVAPAYNSLPPQPMMQQQPPPGFYASQNSMYPPPPPALPFSQATDPTYEPSLPGPSFY